MGAESAQLNFHGTANNGPASTYFEYWKSADPANKLTTPVRNWPAGASAPFGELVQHLSPSTAYSFRLCGNDQGKSPICVTTKQFTTGVARSHLDYNSSTGTWEFQDDPGVNSNMDALYNCNFLGFCDSVFEERSSCGSESGLTCGSQIVAPNSCQVGGGGTDSSAVCAVSESVAVKLGDLDDRAVVEGSGWSRATIDGGSGDDSLYYLGAYAPGRTMTGGTGARHPVDRPGERHDQCPQRGLPRPRHRSVDQVRGWRRHGVRGPVRSDQRGRKRLRARVQALIREGDCRFG
ncbi:MAG: hypothetical protein WA696_03775 [Solirubrobacterales bacterium]